MKKIFGNSQSQKLIKQVFQPDANPINVIVGPSYTGKQTFVQEVLAEELEEVDTLIVDKSIDSARSVISFCSTRPTFSNYKAVIVEQAHELTEPAQDAYLRLCEQPPDFLRLFFITEDFEILLPALKSRIHSVIRWSKLSDSEITEFIESEPINPDIEAKNLCDGHPGLYSVILADHELKSFHQEILKLFDDANPLTSPIPSALSSIKEDNKRDAIINICIYTSRLLLQKKASRQKVSGLLQFASVLKRYTAANPQIYWEKFILSSLV